MPRAGTAVCGTALAVAVLCCGCSADATSANVRTTFDRAFARLFVQQQDDLGRAGPRVGDFYTDTSCRKGVRGSAQAGSGDDWICVELWQESPQRVAATYELSVRTDNCLVATGPASVVGGPTITGSDGRSIVNPLYQFDACFG